MMPDVDADFHRAVGDFLRNSNMIGESAVVGDFLGVVEITDLNDDSEQTQYGLLLTGNVPKHRVWGLVKVAQDLLEGQQ